MSETAFLRLCVACTVAWLCVTVTTGAPPSTSPGRDSTDGQRVNDEGDSPPGRGVNVAFIVGMVVLILFLTAVLICLACFIGCYGRKHRSAAKQNASSESESAGNVTSRWKGESNYFTEKDDEDVQPRRSQPNVSPNTYSNFETSPNGHQDDGSKDTKTQNKHSTNNGRINEKTLNDTAMKVERQLTRTSADTSTFGGRDDTARKESSIDENANSSDSFEVVSQLSGGQGQTDYERQGELFLSRVAQHASERGTDRQESTGNPQQRHIVDSPALIQQYLVQNEGSDGVYEADQPEATTWLSSVAASSVDRLQVHRENNWSLAVDGRAHEHNNVHRHSRKHRARSGSVSSGGQDRIPSRELEPASLVVLQPLPVGDDNPSRPADALSSSHMDDIAKPSLHRWAPNDDLSVNCSQDAGSNNGDDTAPTPTSPTCGDRALVTQSAIERQSNGISEYADASPIRQQHAPNIDVESVSRKSKLPPLSHVSHTHPDMPEHGSRKTKRHDRRSEQHPRSDDEAASSGSRRKKHRHHKHRRDGDSVKSESAQGDKVMSANQDEQTNDVASSVDEDGDDNKKERRKHREKHHSRRLDTTADGTHSKHGFRHVEPSSESAMKDLVISYKKSHRKKTLKHSDGEDVHDNI